jgi:23S rRNA pseudouridine2605 synthase
LPPPKHKRSTDEIFSEPQRLHKVLASCGFGSRRAMEELILAGRITVNRMPADVGQKVGPGDEVRINCDLVKVRFSEPRPRVLMYHKPAGELVTRDDPEGRPTVFAKLPSIGNGRWINVGRLDYNTEGLLLFTNSGELANRLMHPRYEVEREYAVRIMGRLADEQMQALTSGIQLDDGPARCEKVSDGGGDDDGSNHWYHVVLKEGRNREVRRLFEALGVMVSRLIRTRFGAVAMPTHLKREHVAELESGEVDAIIASAGLRSSAERPPQRSDARSAPSGKGKGGPSLGGGRPPSNAHKPRPTGRADRARHSTRRRGLKAARKRRLWATRRRHRRTRALPAGPPSSIRRMRAPGSIAAGRESRRKRVARGLHATNHDASPRSRTRKARGRRIRVTISMKCSRKATRMHRRSGAARWRSPVVRSVRMPMMARLGIAAVRARTRQVSGTGADAQRAPWVPVPSAIGAMRPKVTTTSRMQNPWRRRRFAPSARERWFRPTSLPTRTVTPPRVPSDPRSRTTSRKRDGRDRR